jgi:hypothetical protein
MKDRNAYQEVVDHVRRELVGLPFTRRQEAPLLLQALTLEILLDVRDLLVQIETSTDRVDGQVQEIGTQIRHIR